MIFRNKKHSKFPNVTLLSLVYCLEYAVITGPTHFHFINRDSYRSRVDGAIGEKTVIFDLRKLVYIDCSAIMTLQELHHQYNKEKTRFYILTESNLLKEKLNAYEDKKVTVHTQLSSIIENAL